MERDIIAVLFVGLIIISTHTLTWSVTLIVANVIYTRVISTHTLTWSVTRLRNNNYTDRNDFNSHAHVERDARKIYAASLFHISTHTLTWSVTSYLSLAYDNIDISTHTLTWSVTSSVVTLQPSTIFQLTRSRGA